MPPDPLALAGPLGGRIGYPAALEPPFLKSYIRHCIVYYGTPYMTLWTHLDMQMYFTILNVPHYHP